MSADLDDLFEQLDPPPGGAERFRERLDAVGQQHRAPPLRLAVAVSVAVVVVVVGGLMALYVGGQHNDAPAANRVAAAPEFDRLLGRPVERVEPAVTVNDEIVTLAIVQSENAKIRIYRIQ